MTDTQLIFLSYASPDRDRVMEFHDFLASAGFDVWMDKRQLKGGQNWDFEIKKALQKAAVVVVFLSANSVNRRGYAQREIKIALDHARDKLIDDIYVIPVLLDADVPIPEQLRDIHVILADEGDPKEQLADAIRHQLDRLGVEAARVQVENRLKWSFSRYRDAWEGLPGYEIELQLIRLSSEDNPQVSEITDIIKGWLMSQVMEQRSVRFEQNPEFYNFGESRFFRQNSYDASCGEPKIKERVISMSYNAWWHSAKAAHPNHFFRTFAFTLDPVTEIKSLQEIFEDSDAALAVISEEAQRQLLGQEFEGMTTNDEALALPEEWVRSGTQTWDDLGSFIFGDEGIELLFAPYQVAAYAFGPQFVTIPYGHVVKLMKKDFAHALGVEHLTWSQSSQPTETEAEKLPAAIADESEPPATNEKKGT